MSSKSTRQRSKPPVLTGYRKVSTITVDPGGSWGARMGLGDVVRITDLKGQQAVDFLCYSASDRRDRYNAANTMKMAGNVYLNAGTVLYSEFANTLMRIRASSCRDHDTIGGCCSVEMNYLRYGRRTHSCRANFLHELTKFGMTESDIVTNVNFFMSVPVGARGEMAIGDGSSVAGDFVDVEALTDVVAVLSNCPQKYNPAAGYNPTEILVEHYRKGR